MIQASPHPLLIAPRNPAGDLPDSVKMPEMPAPSKSPLQSQASKSLEIKALCLLFLQAYLHYFSDLS